MAMRFVFSVSEHKQRLVNMRKALLRLEEQTARAKEQEDSLRILCAVLNAQIERAEKEGRSYFDSDKFNKPRKVRS